MVLAIASAASPKFPVRFPSAQAQLGIGAVLVTSHGPWLAGTGTLA